jgi:hypothetical protein
MTLALPEVPPITHGGRVPVSNPGLMTPLTLQGGGGAGVRVGVAVGGLVGVLVGVLVVEQGVISDTSSTTIATKWSGWFTQLSQ